jgi:hypothetical protein
MYHYRLQNKLGYKKREVGKKEYVPTKDSRNVHKQKKIDVY